MLRLINSQQDRIYTVFKRVYISLNNYAYFALIRYWMNMIFYIALLIDFSLTVKAATLIFISGCGSAISSAKEEKSGYIYNLVKNL